jgi:sugar lactone lactonase YvrE
VGGVGPEDVAVDGEGHIFTGVEDGRILRVSADGSRVDTVAHTGGRPLGVELHPDGTLVVCDPFRGLLRIDPQDGRVDTLATEVDGTPIRYFDNAHVAPDGRIYFSDSSQRFGHEHWRADIVEHSGTGRLLRWDPDGAVEVLLEGLQFANGVVVAPDQSHVVVAETGAYRVTKLWLSGDRAGRTETLIDNLPAFPDNASLGDDGLLWIALPSPRNPALDRVHRLHPMVRRMVWALPERLQMQPKKTMWVMALDWDGKVVHDLQRSDVPHTFVTGVRQRHGKVYLGSLTASTIAVLDL